MLISDFATFDYATTDRSVHFYRHKGAKTQRATYTFFRRYGTHYASRLCAFVAKLFATKAQRR